MALPIKPLDIAEPWNCHGCGHCCRGSIIPLADDEVSRIRQQRWHERPEFQGRRILVRQGWLGKRYRLGAQEDGSCVFLMPDGRCQIHAEHGAEAKPRVCQAFPLQLVPLGKSALLTVRRSCPSAAAGRGTAIAPERGDLRTTVRWLASKLNANRAPAITPGLHKDWADFFVVGGALAQLLRDERYPLVRRLVHGLKFCDDLERCHLGEIAGQRLGELVAMLQMSASEGAGNWFEHRQPPGVKAKWLFQSLAFEYARLHRRLRETMVRASAGQRASIWWSVFRGKSPQLLQTAIQSPDTDRPLGALEAEVRQPLEAYFTSSAASYQYAVLGRRGWSLVEGFRSLAASYAVAMWMLRVTASDRPTAGDMIDVVVAIDRGQGYTSLASRGARRRLGALGNGGELPRLLAWYAR